MKRDFKGIWIPKSIWLNKELSVVEKCLIVEIDSLDNDPEKGCFASNEYFGEFFNLSAGRIANMISDLKKRGFVFQVFFDGRNRGLRVHENVKAEYTKPLTLPSRKREHNNKEINKEDSIGNDPKFSLKNNSDKTPSPPQQKNKVVVSLPSPAASPAPATETKPPMHILDVQQQQEQSVTATPPDWMEIAKLMTEYAKGEGAQQWEYMATVQGYKGEPERILANWASKATPYQLMNWKKEFAKIQTWMRTEAVNDLKNKVIPQTGKQNIKIF